MTDQVAIATSQQLPTDLWQRQSSDMNPAIHVFVAMSKQRREASKSAISRNVTATSYRLIATSNSDMKPAAHRFVATSKQRHEASSSPIRCNVKAAT
ncbi:hypothetical protein Y032_0023g702 [Ancylostoma ceylanicum]|uniref:Uncharacterized protein n=1 Tax=Ancylostoma ceylanicum TaxID=53326 RepID=A0A016UZ52_9BILA|nr:hypothetical protein Y032_0023g702 [Ancylostoma ceylanicum]